MMLHTETDVINQSSSMFFSSADYAMEMTVAAAAAATATAAATMAAAVGGGGGGGDAAEFSGEIDAGLPLSLQQLLKNEWLQQNMSQMLNISKDNLDSLLITAQNTIANKSQEPSSLSMPLTITLTTFYALIFVAGVLGNLITCFVISKCKFMHTATNFYLFNLAVSDLILLLSGLPQELYNLWYPYSYPPADALCVMESVLSETAANATVLTITAFTVERYIAICHPFRQHTMSKLSRAIKFIFAIWVMAFLLALPQAMQFSVVKQKNGSTSCTMPNDFFAHVFAVSGFIFFGGPMTAICVLYVLIGVKLKRSRMLQAMPRRAYDLHRGISAQGRVIRMLVAVAVAFFLCWAPFHTQRLMAVYGSTAGIDSQVFNEIFQILDYTAGVLYFLSTCINPLLYNIMSHKFREAFKVTLARHFGLAGMYHVQNRNYSALLRQNGSIRLHTTVNNNALEQFSSYRVMQLQCRDPSHHHLSLQDSIRTTITTTTINSASCGSGGNNSCRSSMHRNRCISVGSKGGMLPASAAAAMLANNSAATTTTTMAAVAAAAGAAQKNGIVDRPPRILHKQISQLSSLGDANSLLEVDGCSSTYHLKELKRSTLTGIGNGGGVGGGGGGGGGNSGGGSCRNDPAYVSGSNSTGGGGGGAAEDYDGSAKLKLTNERRHSLNSCLDWDENVRSKQKPKIQTPTADHDTQLYSSQTPVTFTAVNSIAELNQPSRSRLKLSRIISRRERSPFIVQTSPRTEIVPAQAQVLHHTSEHQQKKKKKSKTPSHSHSHSHSKANGKAQARKTNQKLNNLTEKFHWRFWRKASEAPINSAEEDTRHALMSVSATGGYGGGGGGGGGGVGGGGGGGGGGFGASQAL